MEGTIHVPEIVIEIHENDLENNAIYLRVDSKQIYTQTKTQIKTILKLKISFT